MRLKRELGFLTLISIVIGSLLGAGAFANPSLLAQYKLSGLIGLAIACLGAISLSLVFSSLASHLPKNGGPHVFVSEAFGRVAGFFTAWIYWIISWLSNAVLLSTIVGYLVIMTGDLRPMEIVILESLIVLLITYINIVGVKFSGEVGVVLTILKLIPFFVLPVIFFTAFDTDNFKSSFQDMHFDFGFATTISKVILLGFFGFIGVECATTPAERVKNPKKTIPKALIIGTAVVAVVYILNVVSMVGVVGFEKLGSTNAPYAFVIEKIFGSASKIAIAVTSVIICVGTLNAWTLASGQIAYGAYEDKLFPKIFGKTNKAGAPIAALLLAAVGMITCFIVQQSDSLKDSLIKLVGISCSIFLYIYLVCCVAYMKLIGKWKKTVSEKIRGYSLAGFSMIFCIYVLAGDVLWENGLSTLSILGLFIALGIPVFVKNRGNIVT